jgi:hypothetical protein
MSRHPLHFRSVSCRPKCRQRFHFDHMEWSPRRLAKWSERLCFRRWVIKFGRSCSLHTGTCTCNVRQGKAKVFRKFPDFRILLQFGVIEKALPKTSRFYPTSWSHALMPVGLIPPDCDQ